MDLNLQPPPSRQLPVAPVSPRTNTNGLIGLCFSSLGLAGWLSTLFLIAWLENDKDNSLLDLFVYLIQVMTGLFGFATCLTFSFVGTIVSAIGLPHEPKRLAIAGFGIGIAGLMIGLGMYLWRMSAWGLLS